MMWWKKFLGNEIKSSLVYPSDKFRNSSYDFSINWCSIIDSGLVTICCDELSAWSLIGFNYLVNALQIMANK